MTLNAVIEKWRDKLQGQIVANAGHHYVVWCLLFTDFDGESPYLNHAELLELCHDYMGCDETEYLVLERTKTVAKSL